jgi:hypothetical protein
LEHFAGKRQSYDYPKNQLPEANHLAGAVLPKLGDGAAKLL